MTQKCREDSTDNVAERNEENAKELLDSKIG